MNKQRVRLSQIYVGVRRRDSVDEHTVVGLVESIKKMGLQSPISIYVADDIEVDGEVLSSVPVLVAGRHRLEALLRLGEEYTECTVFPDKTTADLWEVSENLHRADLTVDERSEHRITWMRLMGIINEDGEVVDKTGQVDQFSKGGAGRGNEGGLSLAVRTMPKLDGKTEEAKRSQLRRDLKIASRTPEVKDACRDAGLDDNQSALLEVASQATPEAQLSKVAEIVDRKAARRNVGESDPTDTEARKAAQRQKFWKFWASLDDDVREELHAQLRTL